MSDSVVPEPEAERDDLVEQLSMALDEESDVAHGRLHRQGDRLVNTEELSDRVSVEKVRRFAGYVESKPTHHEVESELEEIKRETKKSLPSYVGSVVFHLFLLLVLSLVILFPYVPKPPEILLRTTIVYEKEELGEDSDQDAEEEAQDEAAPQQEVDAPEVEQLHDEGEPAKVVSDNVTNRFGRAKEDALRRFGGTPGSERAVKQGLRWLSLHHRNGTWDPYGYQHNCPSMSTCAGAGRNSHGDLTVGVTGLALLAFIGNGQTPRRGEFRATAAAGTKALLSSQDGAGCFGGRVGGKYMYNHALALLAMIEMYGVTGDEELRDSAERGLRFLVDAQQQRDGGWDYLARQGRRSDTSVTGWCVLALKAARAAELRVPEDVWEASKSFIEEMTEPGGELRYCTYPSAIGNDAELDQRGVALMAVGLASRLFLGERRDDPAVKRIAKRIGSEPPDRGIIEKQSAYGHDMYYWYYGTLAMFQMGGVDWAGWNDRTRDMVVDLQRLDGHAAGSWDVPNSFGGREAGRVYTTAICVLILETYYRYLPIYSMLKDEIGEDLPRDPPQPAGRLPDGAIDFAKDPELGAAAKILEGGSLLQRVRTIRELGFSANPGAGALLRETYRSSEDVNIRRNLLKALAQLGGDRSNDIFLDALASDDESLRNVAVEELPRLTGKGSRSAERWVEFLRQ